LTATDRTRPRGFIKLCDAFDLPILFLCDTPGDHGRSGDREDRAGAAFVANVFDRGKCDGAIFTIVLREKHTDSAESRWRRGVSTAPLFSVAWPTGEFGPMGLEGAVKLGYRNELAAIEDPAEREKEI